MSLLPAAHPDNDFDFATFLQKFDRALGFDFDIADIDGLTELDFFYFNDAGLLFVLFVFADLIVTVFAVI